MKILVLSTWFPYPLDQGSKIRAYHLLKGLADHHELTLVSFRDRPIDPPWIRHIEAYCSRIEIVDRDPFVATSMRRLLGWFTLRPASVSATYSDEMDVRVREIASEWRPDCILALTFVTAPYALSAHRLCDHALLVADVDNLTARMLREECRQAGGVLTRARRLLAWWKFRRYETWLFRQFDLNLTVTEGDRRTLLAMLKGPSQQVAVAANGVDTNHHQTGLTQPEPDTLVFSGALTYSANYQAMEFFLNEVFPSIIESVPATRLRITGNHAGVRTDRLRLGEHASLTGYLEDIRPTVAASWASVVPLLSGGGTRIKILESMALGTPVVSTPKGAEGLDVKDGEHLLIADSPRLFAEQTIRLLRDPELRARLASNARRLVVEKYEWPLIGSRLRSMLESADAGMSGSSTVLKPSMGRSFEEKGQASNAGEARRKESGFD